MEASEQTISSRREKLNAQIIGKVLKDPKLNLISRDYLLDTLQVLFDECSIESLQKYDKYILQFVEKYKNTMLELKRVRVNITDFEIKDLIGRGHFGEVHVVKEKQTGDVYAMKTLRKHDSLEKTSFDIEREIMAFSNSPWITCLQYAFQDSIYLFFVMEFHPGGDLLTLLYRQGTLPESAATFYLAELILALEDLHAMGYVHRDIKPDNILLDRCGHLKLVDFGSAAKLNQQGFVDKGMPVGTPDYVAPEVLQSVEGKNSKHSGYGASCDYWSLGVLAYELTIGKPPFSAQNATATYARIINHTNNLKFPADVLLTQAYISFVKSLIVDQKLRLNHQQLKQHCLFKNLHFESLRDQVPPYVPKITASDDISNFTEVSVKKMGPNVENFKKKTQFSGRNLPFIGFTYTHGFNSCEQHFDRSLIANEEFIKNMKEEMEVMRRNLMNYEDFEDQKLNLEKKVIEKSQKLENIEVIRNKLERDLAASIADCTALRRTLEIERKDRTELERKALDLIKSAKIKWETSERNKVEGLKLEIKQQQEKILQLVATNTMLNEQLQRVFKLEEDKHKESFEAVEQLSRRSVIGLESRLEKVNLETKNKISSMQTCLDKAVQQKQALEVEITKLQNKEKKQTLEMEKFRNNYAALQHKTCDMEKLVKELSQRVGDLEIETEKSENLKVDISKLTTELESRNEKIRDLENRMFSLQNENKCIEEYKSQINSLKNAKSETEKKINELESKLHEEVDKCQSLRKQLQDSEALTDETQELKELRVRMWKMEKEFSNAKIDKRIVERELKEAESRTKELDEEINRLNTTIQDNKKIHQSALLELNNINENLSLELVKLKESYKNLKDKLENEKIRYEDEKSIISELKGIINEKDLKISEHLSQSNYFKDELRSVQSYCKSAEEEKNRAIADLQKLKNDNHQLHRELEDTKLQLENTRMNLEALREACVLIENQVIEYENINASIQAEKSNMIENTEKLIKDLCEAKENTQEAKKMMNEEKSKRLLCETKIKRLQEDIECLQNECTSYKEQSLKYRECSNNLSDELSVAEEKVSDLEVTLKSYERQIEELISENNLLKEEISQHFTQIASLKESNFKLKQHVQDLKRSETMFIQKVHELESTLHSKISFYEDRELKRESTIKQQTKLIDYLQVKLDEHTQKKRTLTGYLFGHSKKENQPPVTLPINYKDLENQLQRQKQISKDLQDEVFRLKIELSSRANIEHQTPKVERHKSEIVSPQTKFAMEQLGKSPSTNKSEVFRHNSVQRMYHNIPHRFVTKLCKNLSKCDHCENQIILGRDMSVCSECDVCVHPDCSKSLKGTCGLPTAYVKHFRDSLNKSSVPPNTKDHTASVNIEGWIKVLSKKDSWDKRYACLTNQHLSIYTNPPNENGTLIQSFELSIPNSRKKIILEPLPSEIGVNVASTDLPFVLKIEISVDSTCWPPISVVFMALSTAGRDKWFNAFQRLFSENSNSYNIDSVLTVPDRLYVNCLLELTKNIKVLGTDDGLYSYYNDFLLQIDGLLGVSQICIFPEVSIVVMIAQKNNVLVSCDLNHLINLTQCAPCSKPVLTYKDIAVKNLDCFHFLEVSRVVQHPMLCSATSKQVVIMQYDLDENNFIPLRIMDTAEPVSCAHFTEHSLIVGADKFFEIDLSSFKAEEFLDSSDINLRNAIKCHKLRSFPLAILEIFDNPKEYLLCFNEFMVLVDEYGRCSRTNEIRSSYLPIGCHFIKPYLYIIQFSGVEILKISEDALKSDCDILRATVELKKMRYLGQNKRGIYVAHDSNIIKLLEGKQLILSDDSSTISQSTDTDEESERFSFTSSIVQSLDGNFTDTESGTTDDVSKRVTFSQTNFS